MHGAWMFDLLLLVLTGGLTGLAFRQFTRENDPNDQILIDLNRSTINLNSAGLTAADLSAPSRCRPRPASRIGRLSFRGAPAHERRPPVRPAEECHRRGHEHGAHHEGVEQDADGQSESDLTHLTVARPLPPTTANTANVPASTRPAEVTVVRWLDGPDHGLTQRPWAASSRMRS